MVLVIAILVDMFLVIVIAGGDGSGNYINGKDVPDFFVYKVEVHGSNEAIIKFNSSYTQSFYFFYFLFC